MRAAVQKIVSDLGQVSHRVFIKKSLEMLTVCLQINVLVNNAANSLGTDM